jgi:hypothetical protein
MLVQVSIATILYLIPTPYKYNSSYLRSKIPTLDP